MIQGVDLVGLIGRHLPLKKGGRYWWALCPFHDDHSPSFAVNPARQLFYCFGCRKGGDAASFLMMLQGLSFPEALEALGAYRGAMAPERPRNRDGGNGDDSGGTAAQEDVLKALEAATRFYHAVLQKGGEGSALLAQRSIPSGLVSKFRIGYAPKSWVAVTSFLRRKGFSLEVAASAGLTVVRRRGGGRFDRFRGRIMFPISAPSGQPLGFGGFSPNPADSPSGQPRYLNTPGSETFNKGAALFGASQARAAVARSRRAILVEGFFDVLALHRIGVPHTLACMGTRVTTEHAALLQRMGAEGVTLLFDADPEGSQGAEQAGRLLSSRGMRIDIATLPDGEDPDSLLRVAGPEALRNIVSAPTPTSPI